MPGEKRHSRYGRSLTNEFVFGDDAQTVRRFDFLFGRLVGLFEREDEPEPPGAERERKVRSNDFHDYASTRCHRQIAMAP